MVMKLPRLFDIFWPSTWRKPLCSQYIGHDRRAVGTARLGDLVFVVREDEVDTAAMDIELVRPAPFPSSESSVLHVLPQPLVGHGRAFQVPARPPECPRGSPIPARPCEEGFQSTKSIGSRL